jgi:cyclase
MGNPQEFARRYYEAGADELIYIDIVASLYERNNLTDIVSKTATNVFIPITVGGGVRSVEDVKILLRAGADKVAINTAAVRNPNLVTEVAQRFGSQCMVLSIEAKQTAPNRWEAYTDNGREKTGVDVLAWVRRGVELGAGEILLTSVDREGTRKGFDIDLVRAVSTEWAPLSTSSRSFAKATPMLSPWRMFYTTNGSPSPTFAKLVSAP